MITILVTTVFGLAGYYFWRDFGGILEAKVKRETTDQGRRIQITLELIRAAARRLTIIDHRPTVDDTLYNNSDVVRALLNQMRARPELIVEHASATTVPTMFSDTYERHTRGHVKRGVLQPGRALTIMIDDGARAYVVGMWGHASLYDLERVTEKVRRTPFMLGQQMNEADEIFEPGVLDEEQGEPTPPRPREQSR